MDCGGEKGDFLDMGLWIWVNPHSAAVVLCGCCVMARLGQVGSIRARNEMSVKVEKKDHLVESCTRGQDSPPVKSAGER